MAPEDAEVRAWLVKAAHDRRMAQLAAGESPPLTDAAAFHCQQAAEKLLKAFLFRSGEPFEKVHDLGSLIDLCVKHDPSFSILRDRADTLTPFAVRFRYPGPGDPSAQQMKDAMKITDEVWAFVISRLPPQVRP